MSYLPTIQSRMWLGPHLNVQGDSGATTWIENGQPSIVKLIDTDPPGEFFQRPDWSLWIGRHYESDFDPNEPTKSGFSTDAKQAAQQYIDRYLINSIKTKPLIKCWEMNNEPVISTPEQMQWFAAFLAEAARILRETYNVTPVLGNWSAGNPLRELNLWQYYTPVLEAVHRYGAILGRHSYGPLDEYYGLRHRYDNKVFTERGYPNLPVAITECGADSVTAPDGPNQPWKSYYGSDANAYGDYLVKLEAALREDAAYCLGGTVFTYGMGWDPHNINGTNIGARLGQIGKNLPLNTLVTTPPAKTTSTSTSPATKPATTPPASTETHSVKQEATTYAYPWTTKATPTIRRTLTAGAKVTVYGVYKLKVDAKSWAAISAASDEWVDTSLLQEL